jgi:hypothetical protein
VVPAQVPAHGSVENSHREAALSSLGNHGKATF